MTQEFQAHYAVNYDVKYTGFVKSWALISNTGGYNKKQMKPFRHIVIEGHLSCTFFYHLLADAVVRNGKKCRFKSGILCNTKNLKNNKLIRT